MYVGWAVEVVPGSPIVGSTRGPERLVTNEPGRGLADAFWFHRRLARSGARARRKKVWLETRCFVRRLPELVRQRALERGGGGGGGHKVRDLTRRQWHGACRLSEWGRRAMHVAEWRRRAASDSAHEVCVCGGQIAHRMVAWKIYHMCPGLGWEGCDEEAANGYEGAVVMTSGTRGILVYSSKIKQREASSTASASEKESRGWFTGPQGGNGSGDK